MFDKFQAGRKDAKKFRDQDDFVKRLWGLFDGTTSKIMKNATVTYRTVRYRAIRYRPGLSVIRKSPINKLRSYKYPRTPSCFSKSLLALYLANGLCATTEVCSPPVTHRDSISTCTGPRWLVLYRKLSIVLCLPAWTVRFPIRHELTTYSSLNI